MDLVRGVLAETIVLSAGASVVGLALSAAVLKWFASAAAEIPRLPVRIDTPVTAAVAVLTLAAALLCGTVPAWHAARGDFSGFLKPTSASTPGAWKMRRFLVIAQIACSCTLLIGAGLLVRTVTVLLHEEAGFDARAAMAARIVLSDRVLAGAEK